MIKDEQFYIDFPEPYKRRELNSKYREIPLKDTTSRQLRKYFNAMANLYGIIPLRKAHEIISSQSPKLVTRDEFLAFAEIARHECEDYYILGLDELYVDGELKDVLDREIIDVLAHWRWVGQIPCAPEKPAGKALLCSIEGRTAGLR